MDWASATTIKSGDKIYYKTHTLLQVLEIESGGVVVTNVRTDGSLSKSPFTLSWSDLISNGVPLQRKEDVQCLNQSTKT